MKPNKLKKNLKSESVDLLRTKKAIQPIAQDSSQSGQNFVFQLLGCEPYPLDLIIRGL